MGWYSRPYLKAFHQALPGRSPEDVYRLIRVLFPTADYVANSPGGVNVGLMSTSSFSINMLTVLHRM